MEIKVKLNNLRIAPRKVRQVADLIRGKTVPEAQSLLSFTINKPARAILKLLNSAVATARNKQLNDTNLFVSKITVDEGPKLKRWHPMSRGRAYLILKRSSHINLVLSDRKDNKKKEGASAKKREKKEEIINTEKKVKNKK